ncbi:hypothetical protein [Paenibacillus bovis]|uniref:Knr4/Smi1-like domain-containing protein n=1 Tax=Paenibacillus bovis TaxID=1616788 RepID=A0A172ZDF5_9BACL|nr:hypothetical protein [Paenibacillus bovis]ANF95701.1 hypothetical protein AR543_06605 [Paenibacillus bovis]
MQSVSQLLDQYKIRFPARMEEKVQELVATGMIEMEARSHIRLKIAPGIMVDHLPTLDREVQQPISSQLRERFSYAGSWQDLGEHLLDPVQMSELMHRSHFREWITGMREHRQDSAPALYPDNQLSVLSVISEQDGDYTLLIWPEEPAEPQVWRYQGQQEQQFNDLADWLRWMNGIAT